MPPDLRPYPAYKPSGVSWLRDAPVHWEVVQLGRVGVFFKGSGGTKDDEVPDGIPCVRYGDLYTTHKFFVSHTRSHVSPEKASAYTPINRGDVLFPTSGETIEEIGKSAVNLLNTRVLCGGDMIIFRPTIPMEPEFAGYALDCPAAQTQKSLMGRGITIMHIYSGQLKYLWLSLPPLPEQHAIVRYLDYVDRRIRRYVAAKRKLITLLEEEKQAVVNHAVTRGLDPNVRLKPSGVEWLGDVPEHWERRRLKTILRPIDRRSTTGSENLLSLRRDFGVVLYDEHFKRPSQSRSLVGFKLVGVGQLVVNRLQANNGLIFASTIEGLVSPDYSVFEGSTPVHMKFLSDLLRAHFYRAYFRRNATGLGTGTAGFLRLYDDTLLETPVYLPNIREQGTVVEHLDRATADIDAAKDRARRQVELVDEYRTRLIADVVTGKLDVREVAAQLPDEADEGYPIEENHPGADGLDDVPYNPHEWPVEERAMESEVSA